MVRQCTTEQMCETRTLTPTARWQDKSREARGGRSAGKRAIIKDLAQCAPAHDSLPIRVSHCKYKQQRTSRAERDDTRR
jgi:chitodextrinase